MDTKLKQNIIRTPIGEMITLATETGLNFLEFQKPTRSKLLEQRLKKWYASFKLIEGENEIIEQTIAWLDDYFKGNFEKLKTPPLEMRGTDFEKSVWEELKNISIGQTVTYGQMAERMGKPQSARAVGSGTRRNPVSLIIPCHRVIGGDGTLTGYGGGLENKKWLLEHEKKVDLKKS